MYIGGTGLAPWISLYLCVFISEEISLCTVKKHENAQPQVNRVVLGKKFSKLWTQENVKDKTGDFKMRIKEMKI